MLLLLSAVADVEVEEVERHRRRRWPSGDDDDTTIFAAFLVLVSVFRGATTRLCIREDRADLIVLVESESKLFH